MPKFVLFSSSKDGHKYDSYFNGWMFGSIVVAVMDKEHAKEYNSREEYKKDLAKLNKRPRKYKAIEVGQLG